MAFYEQPHYAGFKPMSNETEAGSRDLSKRRGSTVGSGASR